MHWLQLLSPIYQLLKLLGSGEYDDYINKQADEVLTHIPEPERGSYDTSDVLTIGKAIYDWARKGGQAKGKKKRKKKRAKKKRRTN